MSRPTFVNTLVFVADMDRALDFYCNLLGQPVAQNHGDFVQLENGLALHRGKALETTIFGRPDARGERYGRGNIVLYFETDDLQTVFEQVSATVELIHPIETQAWGQAVFRCYDHDGHIVEVGEPI